MDYESTSLKETIFHNFDKLDCDAFALEEQWGQKLASVALGGV